ncbi:MAG: sigma-54 dependent transcriptional regulator [Acidobacteriota bacterium]|jgi:two-component system response regulator PilR (NtrC family)|nr:sigma-54 dependent transcriptional regulator [Acidobacteriota bacterium]
MATVLIVDDEPNIIEVLKMSIMDEDVDVLVAGCGREALNILRKHDVDVVISDIRMPDFSGVELLREARKISSGAAFIMITAFATPETAIEALQHGACDYITKPFRMDDMRGALKRALEKKRLSDAAAAPVAADPVNLQAQQGQKLFQALHGSLVVGRSPKMMEVYRTIGAVAMGDSTVLITGDSGTGKELVARAIHAASKRKDRSFVSINCGAFPETLLESELFGYLRGAFTGATANKKGLFEAADGGSIFLDEIGEMTAAMQVKLLRVLQERRLRPLGGTGEIPVDVRVIAATNRDLQADIKDGAFREDLYYRIAVINIHLPALRERAEDIGIMAAFFLHNYAEKSGKNITGISPEAMRRLESYSWPGNIRQLENVIERAVALEAENEIQPERLPDSICHPEKYDDLSGKKLFTLPPDEPFDLEAFLRSVESSLIEQALRQSGGNQTLAAQRLNLTKGSLRHRLHTLGIRS